MTELAKHIEILLLDNDCVIVPGFGGFMAHPASSVYSDEEALFLPPSRTLGFNPQLTVNDSLLAQSYVEAYDISYPEAIRKIESEVEEIRQTLTNTGVFELPDIGRIVTNGEDGYDFEPCLSGILTPDLYALSSFEMEMLNSVKTSAGQDAAEKETAKFTEGRCVRAKKKKRVMAPVMQITQQEEDEAAANEEETTAKVISINVDTLKTIVSTAAIVIFLVLFSLPLGENAPTEERLCSIDSGMLLKLMPHMEQNGTTPMLVTDESQTKHVLPVEDAKSEESVVPNNIKEVEKHEANADVPGRYVIVLSSAGKKGVMQEHAEWLRSKGVKDAHLLEGQGCIKIVTGSYADVNSAAEALRKLKAAVPAVKEGWYYKVR